MLQGAAEALGALGGWLHCCGKLKSVGGRCKPSKCGMYFCHIPIAIDHHVSSWIYLYLSNKGKCSKICSCRLSWVTLSFYSLLLMLSFGSPYFGEWRYVYTRDRCGGMHRRLPDLHCIWQQWGPMPGSPPWPPLCFVLPGMSCPGQCALCFGPFGGWELMPV